MSSSYLTGIFATSPVEPMQSHMDKVFACVSELIPFVEAVLAEDDEQALTLKKNICRLEREADKLKKSLRMQLPKSLFMPVSRRDLLEVLTMQDKVANRAKDISGLMSGRKMRLPKQMGVLYLAFTQRCLDACAQAREAIHELDELLETGFKGNEVDLVVKMLGELDRIEADTDRLQADLRDVLFEIEKDLPPIDAMFLYQMIDWTGDVADRAQRVGSRLQILLAR
ncbi:MAG: TIGR00153 family protein [Gammaproteobacteria bacterium]|nr:TIGR00153 family protein [Gammaproteobacteria bacterium]